jgi:8-oxo-dGTP pyrophosphatase MutT (NUDIX family)
MHSMPRSHEIACAIVLDESKRFLLQQRDDVPGIVYPGMVGLFGGHREGDESFLQCVARELHEELSYAIEPYRFEHLWSYTGPNWGYDSFLRAEYFVVHDVPVEQVVVTEGSLLIVDEDAVANLPTLTPGARFALARFFSRR